MNILLYADDIELISRWEKILNKNYNISIASNEDDIYLARSSLLIIFAAMKITNKELMIKRLKENKNLILVLDQNPSLSKAKDWLDKKIDGYGNAIMKDIFFYSAVESIIAGYSWFSPNIAHEIISSISKKEDNSKDENDIFSTLTSSESSIAEYLKQGYKNIEISKELNISINTVKKHIKNIYAKLNVSDRISFSKLFSKNSKGII